MDFYDTLIHELTHMRWSDYLDIIVVAYLIYRLLLLLRSAGSLKIVRAVFAVFVVLWLTDILDIYTLHFLLEQVVSVGIIALVILFQPELRRILDHVGNVKFKKIFGVENSAHQENEVIITQTVMACEQLSRDRMGALIVFARDNDLEEYCKTGTAIDAQVSEQLLRNIFFVKAALHDGAVIVRNGRIHAAGCVLPLSESKRLSADLGTRHRAGVGISEVSDAVVVIVSEETGTISVAVGGMLKRHLAPQMLERLLRTELMPDEADQPENLAVKLRQKLLKNGKGESKR
jgi:diadenylate cyclase